MWERARGGENFKRRGVDGVTFILKYKSPCWTGCSVVSIGYKATVNYTTGYDRFAKYNTIRLEAAVKLRNLPIMVWWSNGYNSDLTDYFRRVNSFGVAIELTTFD